MDKLDFIIFPLVLLLRASLLVLSLSHSTLSSRWLHGAYNTLFNDQRLLVPKELFHTSLWAATLATNAALILGMTIIHWSYLLMQGCLCVWHFSF